jgi:glycosyltransferase involved in cell wall biosynthesis
MTVSKLRIAHLVSAASGGASKAAYRLHLSLLDKGVDSHYFACLPSNCWPGVEILPRGPVRLKYFWSSLQRMAKAVLTATGRERKEIDFQLVPQGFLPGLDAMSFDLVHFHWVDGSVASLEELDHFKTPILWSLHDMRSYTGGYYYLGSHLKEWLESKGELPAYDMDIHPLIRAVLWKKRAIYRRKKVAAVAPSAWMERCVRQSGIYPDQWIRRIPYEIPHAPWQMASRLIARRELGFPDTAKIILFGADSLSHNRKGGDLLIEALSSLSVEEMDRLGDVRIISFGGGAMERLDRLPIAYQAIGRVDDEGLLASIYAAANVFVAPSREDNLPNVVLESLASGTPVIAFDIGGMQDMITHGVNGHLVEPFSVPGLRKALMEVLSWSEDIALADICRLSVREKFHPEKQLTEMLELYHEFLASNRE